MEFAYLYDTPEERRDAIQRAEAEKLRMLHDDWNPAQPEGVPKGTMLFTDAPEVFAIPLINWATRWLAADTVDKKIAVLAQKLGLV